jgi:hypothetical protein
LPMMLFVIVTSLCVMHWLFWSYGTPVSSVDIKSMKVKNSFNHFKVKNIFEFFSWRTILVIYNPGQNHLRHSIKTFLCGFLPLDRNNLLVCPPPPPQTTLNGGGKGEVF